MTVADEDTVIAVEVVAGQRHDAPRLKPVVRATARPPAFFPPPGAGGVLVGADDGAVDEHPPDLPEGRVGGEQLEQPAEGAGPDREGT